MISKINFTISVKMMDTQLLTVKLIVNTQEKQSSIKGEPETATGVFK